MATKKKATKKATKKAPAKSAAKKVPAKKKVVLDVEAKRAGPRTPKAKKAKKSAPAKGSDIEEEGVSIKPKPPVSLTPFLRSQKQRLLDLRDTLVDSMAGVARDNLRSGAEGSDSSSAYGMHQADAGSDAYDRDFALSLLSQEQDALYEIEEALKRVGIGTYGICEMSGKPILKERLEAMPFARFTVECQERVERESLNGNIRRPMKALFGASGSDSSDSADDSEEGLDDNKD